MLKFLGVGAAYNYRFNNNSAYFIDNKTLYLFDCGEKICDRILKLGLLENVDNVFCFITHLHSDHVGSLEPLMYYLHYIEPKKITVFYPNSQKLKRLLILMGLDFDFEILNDFSLVTNFKIEPIKQKHIAGSYGYFVYGKDERFFYSGDTCVVSKRAIMELEQHKIDEIYHEVTISTNSRIHTHISKLEKLIPFQIRKKVFLMHFSNKKTIDTAKKLGFCVCVEQK